MKPFDKSSYPLQALTVKQKQFFYLVISCHQSGLISQRASANIAKIVYINDYRILIRGRLEIVLGVGQHLDLICAEADLAGHIFHRTHILRRVNRLKYFIEHHYLITFWNELVVCDCHLGSHSGLPSEY